MQRLINTAFKKNMQIYAPQILLVSISSTTQKPEKLNFQNIGLLSMKTLALHIFLLIILYFPNLKLSMAKKIKFRLDQLEIAFLGIRVQKLEEANSK